MPESLSYPFWICMKGRSKTGGKLFGIALTENERLAWENGSPNNWTDEIENSSMAVVYTEGMTGFQSQ